MSDHALCKDTDRAAEDAAAVPSIQHRDLPEQVALLWASLGDIIGRVVRLEGEMDAGQDEEAAPAVCDSASPANGLRTERVTPPWQRAKWDEALAIICDGGDWGRGNNFDHGVLGALVIWADKEMDRLAAERDAARRERDAAQSQCEELERAALVDHQTIGTLRARVAELEGDRRPATWQEEEAAVEGAWLLCGLEPDWPSDEPGTIVRHAESMRREVGRLRDRVAELEAAAAPAANAGGEKQQPVGYGVRTEWGQFRAGLYTSQRAPANLERGDEVVPLYAAPQPRGWLTAEEREEVQGCLRLVRQETSLLEQYQPDHPWMDHWLRTDAALSGLLARETPPRVRRPNPNVVITTVDARERIDRQWIAAIRAAGGEVD